MPSTYTTNTGIEKIATGEQSGTWGNTTNTNLDLIDQSTNGIVEITVSSAATSGSPNSLPITNGALSNGRNVYIEFKDGGDLGGTVFYQLDPNDAEKVVHVRNNLTNQALILFQGTYNSSNDIEIPNGKDMVVKFDGAGSGATVEQIDKNLNPTTVEITGALTGTTATFTTADNNPQLTLTSTDTDSGHGPRMNLVRNPGEAGADGDNLGQIFIQGYNDAGTPELIDYFQLFTEIEDASDGTEDARQIHYVMTGGSQRSRIEHTGSETVINEDSRDVNFRVETDNTVFGLFVDAGNDHVCINTGTDHGGVLNIETTGNGDTVTLACTDTDASTGPVLVLKRAVTGADDDLLGRIRFDGRDDGGNNTTYARIDTQIVDASNGSEDSALLIHSLTGGSERERVRITQAETVFNEGSTDLDFRVESDGSSTMFQVDGGLNRIFMGTGTNANFNATVAVIRNDTASLGDFEGNLILFDNSSSSTATNGGHLLFAGHDGSSERGYAKIIGGKGNSTSGEFDGQLIFKVRDNGDSSIDEKLRIKSGETTFNEVSADQDFRVEGNGDTHLLFVDAGEDRVSIGTSDVTTNAQEGKLKIRNDVDYSSTEFEDNATLMLQNENNNNSACIVFHSNNSAGNSKRCGIVGGNINSNIDGLGLYGTVNNRSNSTPPDVVIESNGDLLVGKTAADNGTKGFTVSQNGGVSCVIKSSDSDGASQNLLLNRQDADGTLVLFRQANNNEGTISVSGSTVSYNGFSGLHESSGIPTDTPIGTVVSTIDELDVYFAKQGDSEEDSPKAGQTRKDHAKVKVSDTVGDKAVYGVVGSFNEQGKVNVASVGIGSIRVTGSCEGGDLLESNGDGTAKVQSDDIIRSKTIGKVTIGNSNTGVKLVSCVLYCG